VQPAPSHRTHPPAVTVDPGTDQRSRRGCQPYQQQRPALSPLSCGRDRGPRPGDRRVLAQLWHASAVPPSMRHAHGIPSAATTASTKSNSGPPRTVDCRRARRCQRCSRSGRLASASAGVRETLAMPGSRPLVDVGTDNRRASEVVTTLGSELRSRKLRCALRTAGSQLQRRRTVRLLDASPGSTRTPASTASQRVSRSCRSSSALRPNESAACRAEQRRDPLACTWFERSGCRPADGAWRHRAGLVWLLGQRQRQSARRPPRRVAMALRDSHRRSAL
jgi:hypothetical protein